MAEQEQDAGKLEQEPAEALKTENEGQGSEPGPIPYERFKEVNSKAKQLEAELEKFKTRLLEKEAADEKARQDKLREQAKWEELAAEWESKYNETAPALESAANELVEYKQVLEQFAEAQAELVPEMFKPIVKAMPVLERLKWLTENKEQLMQPEARGIPRTPPGRTNPELTDDKRRAKSARTF